jgi:5-methylcytosine-specific restriction endonuclease McrA
MKNKYGLSKCCSYCGNAFITKPRFLEYCSVPCKNPINRPGNVAWNKGLKLTEDQKAKQNRSGLTKGWGWNKGQPNEKARARFSENNPNKDGRLNNLRPKKEINDEFLLYKREVRKATYRTLKKMKLTDGYIPKFGKGKYDLQVDHIIPYEQGFELGIPAYLLGSKNNIQFLKGEDNRAKWDHYQPMSVVRAVIGEINGLQ